MEENTQENLICFLSNRTIMDKCEFLMFSLRDFYFWCRLFVLRMNKFTLEEFCWASVLDSKHNTDAHTQRHTHTHTLPFLRALYPPESFPSRKPNTMPYHVFQNLNLSAFKMYIKFLLFILWMIKIITRNPKKCFWKLFDSFMTEHSSVFPFNLSLNLI